MVRPRAAGRGVDGLSEVRSSPRKEGTQALVLDSRLRGNERSLLLTPFVPAKAGTQEPLAAALGPGSRFARLGHENVDSRFRGNEWNSIERRNLSRMNDPSNTPFVGRALPRREDHRLLTGRGQFIADLDLPHMLHAVFVRSPVAHARIGSVHLAPALAAPGVVCALTGADLLELLPPVPDTQLSLPSKWTALVQHKFINPQQPLLAHDKVRHVGEAVAVIVAESRYAAEDAAQLVGLDLDPLPPVVDPEAALRPGAPIVHHKFHTNLIGAFTIGKGDIAAAF